MESYLDYIKGLYEDLELRVTELEEETYEPQKPNCAEFLLQKGTKIYSSDLLFLVSLFDYFGKHSYGYVVLEGTTVHLYLTYYDGNLIRHEIRSKFDIDICSNYYGKVSKFVEEVL